MLEWRILRLLERGIARQTNNTSHPLFKNINYSKDRTRNVINNKDIKAVSS